MVEGDWVADGGKKLAKTTLDGLESFLFIYFLDQQQTSYHITRSTSDSFLADQPVNQLMTISRSVEKIILSYTSKIIKTKTEKNLIQNINI